MHRTKPVLIGSISAGCALLMFLGACSRKGNTGVEKPIVFFAPAIVTNVPEVYKPLYLGNLSADQVEAFRAALPYDSISLERTTASGSNLLYRVTFHRAGQAEYEVFQPNHHQATGQIDLFTFGRLCYALDSGGFKDFQTKYRANPFENAATLVTVSKGKNTKTVANYGAIGPIQLWATEEAIDGVRVRTDWKLVQK